MDPVAECEAAHLEKTPVTRCWRDQVSLGRGAGTSVNFSHLWNYLGFALFISFLKFPNPKTFE